ncbi:hypothetical protein D0Q02_03335 [Micromonospora craniellae]|uniref:Uncharacterized protein n=2 Tax=Micromonospora craniellae TaxID=2294034 RepID=A0A372G557_9ACTN|nr:hypothetical protein D0Q02_03335 [Micromonospora craniellae]
MSFDIDDPPVEPPDECRHRLLWRLARALWETHRPGSSSFCVATGTWHENQPGPCQPARLAQEGMRTACGEPAPTSPPWITVTRERLAVGDIDPRDAVTEALWHHRHTPRAGR